ncbi:MAG: ATP-dependent Clp protease ATP-binding subunit ClpC [Thermotogota bacterium]|nr:ATP-dependent Clp protease ATP-binding subunit ClpC [Thermotogota bacterium]MDK2864863.1 ATP-dependent Clp protease ATP-binding subunit ClpC [Thermotogota bacterium]
MFNPEDFTQKAHQVMMSIQDILSRFKQNQLSSEHILLALLEDNENVAVEALKKINVDVRKVADDLIDAIKALGKIPVPEGSKIVQVFITPDARHVIETAKQEARRMQDEKIGTEHLLLAILKHPETNAARILYKHGASLDRVYSAVLDIRKSGESPEEENLDFLSRFTIDLTQLAAAGKLMPVVGRDEEIKRVMQILGRKTKNNPVLIGDPGVGKTAIVEGLAQRIVKGMVPDYMKGKKVLALDMGRLVAGTKFRGEFEERMKGVIDAVKKLSGEVIMFIDEIHTVVGAGSAEGSMDAANLMKPALARGELQCIGATTVEEYRKHIEKDKALERRFMPVYVEEPSLEETLEILKGVRPTFEKHHGVKITDDALEQAVKLSARFVTERFLPDKAIDLIDEAASKVKLEASYVPHKVVELEEEIQKKMDEMNEAVTAGDYEKAAQLKIEVSDLQEKLNALRSEWETSKKEKLVVDETVVAEIVQQWTKIPVSRMLEPEKKKLKELEKLIHERFVDQEAAVRVVADTVRRARAGLKDPKRPSGVFLFLGPTGVGKTELARTLAEVLFGSEEAMIRIDMSEYTEKHSVSRLIGAPPGYVGYEEAGQLTEAVRRRPYSVILLDEIEKAHPEVFNILLQVFDDGRLTDGKGNTVDFKNTIIIMTSNVASEKMMETAESEGYIDEDQIAEELKETFKPEFLNRLDSIVIFQPLSLEDVKKIVEIKLREAAQLLKEQGIDLVVSEEAKTYLAMSGYAPAYGARPLRRLIEREIINEAARLIIDGEVSEGDTIFVDGDEDGIYLRVEKVKS